jgi:hypothetical protein
MSFTALARISTAPRLVSTPLFPRSLHCSRVRFYELQGSINLSETIFHPPPRRSHFFSYHDDTPNFTPHEPCLTFVFDSFVFILPLNLIFPYIFRLSYCFFHTYSLFFIFTLFIFIPPKTTADIPAPGGGGGYFSTYTPLVSCSKMLDFNPSCSPNRTRSHCPLFKCQTKGKCFIVN